MLLICVAEALLVSDRPLSINLSLPALEGEQKYAQLSK